MAGIARAVGCGAQSASFVDPLDRLCVSKPQNHLNDADGAQIWTHVDDERPNADRPELAVPVLQGTIEKKSMITLVRQSIVPFYTKRDC